MLLLVCLYLACAPFALRIFVPVIQQTDATEGFQYAGKAAKRAGVDMADLRPVPITNTLVIPKIGVDAPVLEGKTEAVLEKGVWRRPLSAVPGKGGNTVLTAHRFKYLSGGNTFYNLDQLQEGDSIIVFWEKQEHEYIVREKRVVGPEETGVEAATDSETLTLYTCTPLWTATKRLVVRATPR